MLSLIISDTPLHEILDWAVLDEWGVNPFELKYPGANLKATGEILSKTPSATSFLHACHCHKNDTDREREREREREKERRERSGRVA